jgi:hypothetical protein
MMEFVLGNLRQRLAIGDLCNGGVAVLSRMIDRPVGVVYSDPPWSPGNETYWRTYAGAGLGDYQRFLNAWVDAVLACPGLRHVFCEQSENDGHRQLFLDVVRQREFLPLIEEWTVVYSAQRRPNRLLHFGEDPLTTDPSGMSGDPMTAKVFEGIRDLAGATVLDPCTGRGTTSRIAHRFGLNFIGLELSEKRLNQTVQWLLKQGYKQK